MITACIYSLIYLFTVLLLLTYLQCMIYVIIYSLFNSIVSIHSLVCSLDAGLAGTRAQSCDRYGSGTLHPRQVLGDSLPLLSPAFRRSQFHRQVPVRPQRREKSQQ